MTTRILKHDCEDFEIALSREGGYQEVGRIGRECGTELIKEGENLRGMIQRLARCSPMLIMLSAMTPSPTQRFICSCLRFSLLVERLGTATRFTPSCLAAVSLAAEKNPASAAARSGTRPNNSLCFSMEGVSKSESLGR